MTPIEVVGAVVVSNGKVLCAQRGPRQALAGLWEFPGGKVEVGESPANALRREILEELGCRVGVGDVIATTEHQYDFAAVGLVTYFCTLETGNPSPMEHQQLAWIEPRNLLDIEWAPADVPTVARVMALLGTASTELD